tara:strand:- start:1693 stop:1842 length:150 start_codon:yes stop_codon:yes gene_type:complete
MSKGAAGAPFFFVALVKADDLVVKRDNLFRTQKVVAGLKPPELSTILEI